MAKKAHHGKIVAKIVLRSWQDLTKIYMEGQPGNTGRFQLKNVRIKLCFSDWGAFDCTQLDVSAVSSL